ncbi:NUDIX domain-containing protein [Leptolyngbya ohadii]|uniref:NUDIX domain-containing protein n=1 Tax=Leptolyngbya ohadii TaxID=1962290 RepID=UPI000B59B15B|nr:NUDIX hydrolase [Leptolyngbya ohadii]
MQKNGPWTIEKTIRQYQNSFITVVEDQVIRPDGQRGTYSTVAMKPGITVLPLDEQDNVYLVRQFRYALGQESLEVITGALESDEPLMEAAQRELAEEAGIHAADWRDLGKFNLDTSIVHCPVHLFLAKSLTSIESHPEGTETIKTCKMPFAQAFTSVMEGAITHAPSCILILKAWHLLTAIE